MQFSTKFLILSKCNKFHLEVGQQLEKKAEYKKYSSFARFFADAKNNNVNALIIDAQTTDLSEDVLNIFTLKEFDFLSTVIVVCENDQTESVKPFIYCKRQNIESCISDAIVAIFKNKLQNQIVQDSSEVQLQCDIKSILNKLGFQAKHIGFHYLREVIEFVQENNGAVVSLSSTIYPKLAQKYGTSSNNIERNIRNSIKGAVENIGKAEFEKLLGSNFSGGEFPPSRAFIMSFYEKYNSDIKGQNSA